MIVIYNDGETCVHYIGDDGVVGTIQRVHTLNGQTIEQATKEEFLADLPVNQAFLADMKLTATSWAAVQGDIVSGLADRGYTAEADFSTSGPLQ